MNAVALSTHHSPEVGPGPLWNLERLANQDAEETIIGALLYRNDWFDEVADRVSEADFFDPLMSRLFAFIAREVEARRRVSVVTIAPHFGADQDYQDRNATKLLAELTASPLCASCPIAAAEAVEQLAVRRRLVAALDSALGAALEPSEPIDRVVAAADDGLTAAIGRNNASPFHNAGTCFDEMLAGFDQPIDGVQSGVVEGMDALIGNVRPGWFGVIAGRPGMGKSATLISYLRGVTMAGHASLLISLEMKRSTVISRLTVDQCHASGAPVDFERLMKGGLQPHHRRQIEALRPHMERLPLYIIDQRCNTLGQIRRAIRRKKKMLQLAGKRLGLVAIDYLQLVRPDRSRGNEFEDVSEVSRTLKQIASDEEVPIIALSQLSRAVEQRQDKRPMLSDLRSSGQIEQDADFAMFLYSEEYYLTKARPLSDDPGFDAWQARLERARDRLEFILAKFRHGAEGVHHGRFFRPFQAVR